MKPETTKNEVAKKAAVLPAVQRHHSIVDASDIVVPRLLLAQGLSQTVANQTAKMGDITNSLTGAVVGGPTTPVNFIPITIKKYWRRFEKVGSKKAYRGVEPFTRENANRPLTEEASSQANPQQKALWEYDLVLEVYGFTEDDVQDPIALPTAISFTRTSYKAGQKVMTHFAALEGALPSPLPYHTYMLTLSCEKKQNDKGIFYVFDVKPKMDGAKAAKTPPAYTAKIERWAQILNDTSRNVVVDEELEEDVGTTGSFDSSRF
jgi:hypothetical protein